MKEASKSLRMDAAIIILATFLAYVPVLGGGFIWDDDRYVTENQMLRSLDGLKRSWIEPGATTRYYPFLFTAFWAQYHLWNLQPLGYHLVNVLLHAANAVLVWLVLRCLKIPGAWMAGLVFAVHPVNVATVAWISEQKNTLSMLFYLIAILLYLKFDEDSRWRWYGFSLASFLLALLSKTAVVMLPVVLLGCIWWLRGRVRWQDFLCAVPFFVLSFISALVTIWVENRANEEAPVRLGGFLSRLAIAGLAPWFYLHKSLLPYGLMVIYPRWQINPSQWVSYVPGMILAGCFALFLWKRRSWGRPLLFGLGYFVVTFFPVLGFFDQTFYAYSLVTDHWQYYSIVGVIALVVAGWEFVCSRINEQHRRLWTAAGVVALMALGVATWTRAAVYVAPETLWQDTVTKNPDAWVAHYNLGVALMEHGKIEDAIRDYELALRLKPDYVVAHNNLGVALRQAGRVEDAIGHYEQALRYRPNYAEAHVNLGSALFQEGKIEDAIGHYEQALRIKPDIVTAHRNLAVILERVGRPNEAIKEYEEALRISPDSPVLEFDLGNALSRAGRVREAIAHCERAVKLNPNYTEARIALAQLRARQ